MSKVKATQMLTRGLNPAPNQITIEVSGGPIYFQSYGATIVKVEGNKTYLDKRYWNYSRTTTKYRNDFLQMSTSEIKDCIKCGKIKLVDLN